MSLVTVFLTTLARELAIGGLVLAVLVLAIESDQAAPIASAVAMLAVLYCAWRRLLAPDPDQGEPHA